jgi:hypothetical protein
LKNPFIWGMALTYFFIYVVRQVRLVKAITLQTDGNITMPDSNNDCKGSDVGTLGD